MTTRGIGDLLKAHKFFEGLSEEAITFIEGCGSNVVFQPDEYIFREGAPADFFYLIRSGRVALEVHAPERGALVLDVVGESEIVGASWLFPPYRWDFDARAVEEVRAVKIDGKCLRAKCEEDHSLGFELMKRVAEILRGRMHSARMRLLDLYGNARVD